MDRRKPQDKDIKMENNENDDSWIWLLRLLDIASLFDNENNDLDKDKENTENE